MLTACAGSTDYVAPQLPATTDRLNACTDQSVPPIPGKPGEPILKGSTAGVIGGQRSSALSKDKCAHDWRDFYEGLRQGIGGKTPDGKPSAEEPQPAPSLLDRIKGLVP